MDAGQKYNESGLCLCGCGQSTRIAKKTIAKNRITKGKPAWFVFGHQSRKRYQISQGGHIHVYAPEHPRASKKHCVSEHVLYAEEILGKYLPARAVIHHVDGDVSRQKGNLVICENHHYHMLLHKRKNALKTCGHVDWLKCLFCHQYDNPENMRLFFTKDGKSRQYHRECENNYNRSYRLKKEEPGVER